MAEGNDHTIAKGAHRRGVRTQVSVIPPRCDRGEADPAWVDLNERHCIMDDYSPSELGLEGLLPPAVVHDYSRPDPGSRSEGADPLVGLRCSALVYPDVVTRRVGRNGRRMQRIGVPFMRGSAMEANQDGRGRGNYHCRDCHNPCELCPTVLAIIWARPWCLANAIPV